jgi:hypothetical protein
MFDSEGSFEVQLWENLDPVLFTMLFEWNGMIIVDPKNMVYQFRMI